MPIPSEAELTDAIADATRKAVSDLMHEYPTHHFYYCSLITTGEAHAPNLVAWSHESLTEEARKAGDQNAERYLKWSYADSPFYCYGEQHYAHVRALFDARPALDPNDPKAWNAEYTTRLAAMEAAVARLDAEGLFGSGPKRNELVLNVEVMPPDVTNTERARRLNPAQALTAWLAEAAEL